MIDVSNNTHVTNIGRLLHETVDLIDREAGSKGKISKIVVYLIKSC